MLPASCVSQRKEDAYAEMLTQHRVLTKMIRGAARVVQLVNVDLVAEVVVEQEDPLGVPMPVLVLEATNRGQAPSSWHLHITCPPPLLAPVLAVRF